MNSKLGRTWFLSRPSRELPSKRERIRSLLESEEVPGVCHHSQLLPVGAVKLLLYVEIRVEPDGRAHHALDLMACNLGISFTWTNKNMARCAGMDNGQMGDL